MGRWWGEAVGQRIAVLRILPLAGRGLVAALLAEDVVLGLLPVAFVVAASAVVGQVPAAVAGGTGPAAWADLTRTPPSKRRPSTCCSSGTPRAPGGSVPGPGRSPCWSATASRPCAWRT